MPLENTPSEIIKWSQIALLFSSNSTTAWVKNRLHNNSNTPNFSNKQKIHLLHKVNQAVAFESFLHKKFVGQKRFSLEGAESLIPALDTLIEHSSLLGVEEFVMGMAHRGRLNVLANIFNKTYKEIFSEFEGKKYEDDLIAGDVKYHLGFTSIQKCTNGNNVKLNLSPNPSHLEAVDPVVIIVLDSNFLFVFFSTYYNSTFF